MENKTIKIRNYLDKDLSQITEIYKYHVLNGTGSFEIEPPNESEMQNRINEILNKNLPFLIAEKDNKILGFSYANLFKNRPAYKYSVEDSIYISENTKKQGIGKLLLTQLMQDCENLGIRKIFAVIGDSNNLGSINLHKSLGFIHSGKLTSVGFKFNRWLDIIFMEKFLGQGDKTKPE